MENIIMEDQLLELEPVSPNAQSLNSSVMSVSVIAVLEFEISIDHSKIISFAGDLIPLNPLYSSIMVRDINGERMWKKVEVNVEEHIVVPTLPSNLPVELYDAYFKEYITNLAQQELPQNKPLWEVHIINHSTCKSVGNLILKHHHSLGDGYSMMGLLISSLTRANDPSLPLTFPSRKFSDQQPQYILSRVSKFFSSAINSILDFGWSIIKSTVLEDDLTPIRSGGDAMELRPITLSTMTFSLHQIKQIKSKLKVTVNDIVTGMIFLGLRLYMQETCPDSIRSNSTAMVLLNTRMLGNYKSIQDMLKPNSDAPWGNRFALLHVDIPKVTDSELSNPLQFIKSAQKLINRKRNSSAVFFLAKLMEMIHKFRGSEMTAKYVYNTLKNSSINISNLIGPNEKMALCGHSVKGVYFVVVGIPQSLRIAVVSYMENLRITLGCEKGFIDHEKLTSCIEKAFGKIVKASLDVSF